MGRIIGIDLGTTNSVVAVVDAGGCRILQNREGEQSTRSIVGYNKGEIVVGRVALNRWPLNPKETIVSIKRLMGRGINDSQINKIRSEFRYEILKPTGFDEGVCVKLGGKEYTPIDISSMILKKLKADAEYVLNEEVTHAVITVPAYFNDKQRHATREAGLKAGLKVMKILDEPTAAAISYGIKSQEQDAKTILVYDLGGGTFDISTLMMGAGAYAPLNLEGDMWLGGDNFDQVIIDHAVKQIIRDYDIDPRNNNKFMTELKIEAQKAKEALSSSKSTSLIIAGKIQDNEGNLIDIDIDITQSEFEELAKPLVERAKNLVLKAIENAHTSISSIDFVLMAGNSTAIPMVQRSMEELFGKEKILRKIHPKYCVAMGAAMTAIIYRGVDCPKCGHSNADLDAKKCEKCGTLLDGAVNSKMCPSCGAQNKEGAEKCSACGSFFLNVDRNDGGCAPYSYGIQTAGDKYSVFIKKSDPYPTPEEDIMVQTFRTIYPNQPSISIPVYGGDNMDRASLNDKQGLAFAVLPPFCPEGTAVRIKLWLNKDGYFELNASLDDGKDLNPKILRDKDTAVALRMESCEVKIAEKIDQFGTEEKKKIDKKREEAYEALMNNDPEKAMKKAGEIEEILNQSKPKTSVSQQAENLIGYCTYITTEYSWLLGQSVYILNNKVEELRNALKKNDASLMNECMDDVEAAIDSIMRSNKLLATFMGMQIYILDNIAPIDPVKSNHLLDELKAIEKSFEDGDAIAASKLNQFSIKLANMGTKDPKKTKKCHTCGHENPFSAVICEQCNALLNVVTGSDPRNSSFSRGK